MKVFFKSIPDIGNLLIEHIFYQYDEPILFVCQDKCENRYLCSCCRLSEKWVIAHVSEKIILDLIDDKITIRGVFEKCRGTIFSLVWDGKTLSLHPADSKSFPVDNEFLELKDCDEDGSLKEYQTKLESSIRERELLHHLVTESQIAYKEYEEIAACIEFSSNVEKECLEFSTATDYDLSQNDLYYRVFPWIDNKLEIAETLAYDTAASTNDLISCGRMQHEMIDDEQEIQINLNAPDAVAA